MKHFRCTNLLDKGLRDTLERRQEVADMSVVRMLRKAVEGRQDPWGDVKVESLTFLMEREKELCRTGKEKVILFEGGEKSTVHM